jgi:hypothetical protein
MAKVRLLTWAALLLSLGSSGCCWWADKWCPQSHAAPQCYAPPPATAPACQPYVPACQPYVPPCQPVAGYPAAPGSGAPAWNQPTGH